MSCRSSTAQVILAEEVDSLRTLVHTLEQRVADLEAKLAEGEFYLIEKEVVEQDQVGPQLPIATAFPTSPQSAPVQRSTAAASGYNREEVLRSIGGWLRSTLAGQRRGLSGREHLKESSRFYLVLRSFGGEVFNPVRVFTTFAQASRVVKPQGRAGDSIFVGLPTIEDCRVVTQAAGLAFPSQIDG